MATPLKFAQCPTFYLAGSGVIVGATSISVTSFQDINGNILTMADFGSKGYVTLEPDTSGEEAATFTGVTANANGTYTLTGVSTALAKSPYTETTGLIRSHAGGTKVVVTDNAAFWNTFTNKNNDETILGNWTFNTQPTALSSTPATTTSLGTSRLSSAPATTLGNPTITIASPAVVTLASHGLTLNDTVQFSTSGALPTGITAGTTYYVISAGLTTNTFEISLTIGGTAVNTSGSQSGTHTLTRTTAISVGNDDTRIPSVTTAQALAGTGGTPSSSNKFVTQTGLASLLPTVQKFTGNGTYTPSAGIKYTIVELVGGGQAGTGSTGTATSAGAGGAGGGYSRKIVSAATIGASQTITIGAGGVGVSGATVGASGGTTSFGAILSATGGASGVGGIGSSGDINIQGQGGGNSTPISGGKGGMGGSSVLGGGAGGTSTAGGQYGGGGSGADGGTSGTGGNGAAGVVLVTEYYV